MSPILRAVLYCSVLLGWFQCGEANGRKNVSQGDDQDEGRGASHSRRSYTMGAGKIMFCRAGPPGPPGPPGTQGVPGRDGRDGRDCPPCNCAGSVTTEIPVPGPSPCPASSSLPPIGAPAPVVGPSSGLGSASNPAKSCDEIYNSAPGSETGVYWMSPVLHGGPYLVHCEMIQPDCNSDTGGWTLVARASGLSPDFAPTSSAWISHDVINPADSADITRTLSMKNAGWFSIHSGVLRVCYSGPRTDCATFTHEKSTTLSELFASQFAVQTKEDYTFDKLLDKFNKHLDLSHLKTEWCGLNLGNLCNIVANPNKHPGSHICRIGCIGVSYATRPSTGSYHDDYTLGIGVSSCNDPSGSAGAMSLHFSAYKGSFGDYDQTAFIYVK